MTQRDGKYSLIFPFGRGEVTIGLGDLAGVPTVWICGSSVPGVAGEECSQESLDALDTFGAILTFPTPEQAQLVYAALRPPISK